MKNDCAEIAPDGANDEVMVRDAPRTGQTAC